MALSREQLAQRVKSAREAVGLRAEDLQRLVQPEGFGKTDIGRMERPNGKAPPPMSPMRSKVLSKHTGFPPEWFTEPDVSKVFGASAPEPSAVDQLTAQVEALSETVRLLRDYVLAEEPEELREQLERADAFARQYEPSSPPVEERTPGERSR